jgi:hypothetical protein
MTNSVSPNPEGAENASQQVNAGAAGTLTGCLSSVLSHLFRLLITRVGRLPEQHERRRPGRPPPAPPGTTYPT